MGKLMNRIKNIIKYWFYLVVEVCTYEKKCFKLHCKPLYLYNLNNIKECVIMHP
jgi:hypothetical protein